MPTPCDQLNFSVIATRQRSYLLNKRQNRMGLQQFNISFLLTYIYNIENQRINSSSLWMKKNLKGL